MSIKHGINFNNIIHTKKNNNNDKISQNKVGTQRVEK